ncbi:hypothetical protein [Haloarcula nitratireducens]|uniref:Uncharacterized protein n=1 Tax=Haloarcula nitratireducens TaxID=2487749 RepID=A0AAW4PHW6_9EURY|nr:hypothetical protein [Halomicroarcula nitratireducens]MBX0297529.1 hypothetical protein [Halomicroarcula nitratireducens]
MSMELNKVNGDASEWAFGFKATSRSLKPVHVAQVIFSHSLGHVHSPEALFKFVEKPGKTPSEELPEEIKEKFEIDPRKRDERLDQIRQTLRKVLANDNALYASQRGSAPTCSSDWFVINPTAGVTVGRFLYHLLVEADADLQRKLNDQLNDHHDSISVLFRPLVKDAQMDSATVKSWDGPDVDNPLEEEKIAHDLATGFGTLAKHLKQPKGGATNYPRDLRRVVKFAGFALYSYMGNRHNEIRSAENACDTRLPLVFNYTGEENGPVADASLECYDAVGTAVHSASRLGVEAELDTRGYRDKSEYDEDGIMKQIKDRKLLDLNRKSDSKRDEDYETFRYLFEGDPADDVFDRLVNTVTDAIHQSRYKTYTPVDTIQTFGWRAGILKPRGNRANERRFAPDPEVLEAIILSVIEPNEQVALQELCQRLRERYGIIVGGTEDDRDHLTEWDISIGASAVESDPLSNRNYERFKEAIIDLGFAHEYADGVTIVSTTAQ